jgi:hypothetical protein
MADDLLSRGVLVGLSRREVIALLGEPDGVSGGDLSYWLGPQRALAAADSEWLSIRLGRDGRVAEAWLTHD